MRAPAPEPVRIVLVVEDRTHTFLATRLMDAALGERLGRRAGEGDRVYGDFAGGAGWYDIRRSKKDAADVGYRSTGRVEGQPRSPEGVVFRRLGFLASKQLAKVLVVLRDTDNDRDLATDARQVEEQLGRKGIAAAIGTPHRDAEGWLLAGYRAQDPDQRQRLDRVKRELSFDPRHEPHRLTAQPNDRPTDAKRVLAFVNGDGEGLAGKGRAPSRPPTDDELREMEAGLADLDQLARFEAAGAGAFVTSVRRVARAVGG